MDKQGCRRRTDPLSRELVRYLVVGGLASLVDVGLLWVLTHGMGVYYLHAAALAFVFGLLTSSPFDCPPLHGMWTPSCPLIRSKIASILSVGCGFYHEMWGNLKNCGARM